MKVSSPRMVLPKWLLAGLAAVVTGFLALTVGSRESRQSNSMKVVIGQSSDFQRTPCQIGLTIPPDVRLEQIEFSNIAYSEIMRAIGLGCGCRSQPFGLIALIEFDLRRA